MAKLRGELGLDEADEIVNAVRDSSLSEIVITSWHVLVKWLEGGVPQGSLCKSPEEKRLDVLSGFIDMCYQSCEVSQNKALAEHEDIDDAVGSEEPTERDHGVDLQQPILIKIDYSDSHKNETDS
ncbi:hypothetical protein OROMI_024630 [Orobanche minor]